MEKVIRDLNKARELTIEFDTTAWGMSCLLYTSRCVYETGRYVSGVAIPGWS